MQVENCFNLPDIRHTLHRLSEPSGEEYRTKQFLLEQLKLLQPTEIHTFEDSCSLLVLYDFGTPTPTLLFRADFDAVRVTESLDLPYASETAGVAHKCGHDGHTAMLLGFAEQLHQHPLSAGRILLFFQASEETGVGAKQLLDSKILDSYTPDFVFALHQIPGIELGTIVAKSDSFTCSVVSCDITLRGQTAHASEPLKAICPYAAAKEIADKLLIHNRYDMALDDFCLFTLIEFRIGQPAYGVAAGDGVLRFTLRAKTDLLLRQMLTFVAETVAAAVAKTDGLSAKVDWKEYFAAANNHDAAVERIQRAACACGYSFSELAQPFPWGEDFGLLTQHFCGALFGIGSGSHQPPLHHPDFDFPDTLLPIGVKLWYTIASSFC